MFIGLALHATTLRKFWFWPRFRKFYSMKELLRVKICFSISWDVYVVIRLYTEIVMTKQYRVFIWKRKPAIFLTATREKENILLTARFSLDTNTVRSDARQSDQPCQIYAVIQKRLPFRKPNWILSTRRKMGCNLWCPMNSENCSVGEGKLSVVNDLCDHNILTKLNS